jgi:hypothetical protein
MAFVLFKDSYKRYKVAGSGDADLRANLKQRYTALNNVGIVDIGAGPELDLTNGAIFKALPHSARWVLGHRYRYASSALANSAIYQLFNNSTVLFALAQNTDGTLALETNNGATVIDVTDRSLFSGIRYYLEWDVTLSGSSPITCTAELRINGHVEASGSASSGINAASLLSGVADANFHRFNGASGGAGTGSFVKDLYIKNEAGYEGDIRNVPIYPASDGGILQWTPNSGSTHFDRVNTHPVDITKWLSTATPGDIDLWGFDTLPAFSGSIVGINISVLVQKDDEGTKSFKIVVGSTGTDAQSDEFFVSTGNPEYYEFSLKLDPATGLAWTAAGVNALIAGVKCIS